MLVINLAITKIHKINFKKEFVLCILGEYLFLFLIM